MYPIDITRQNIPQHRNVIYWILRYSILNISKLICVEVVAIVVEVVVPVVVVVEVVVLAVVVDVEVVVVIIIIIKYWRRR